MNAWHWFLHVTGADNVSGTWYGFWSGFGGCLGLFGAALVYLRHRNCHARWCWRLGRHPVDGTNWVVCRHHHPTITDIPDGRRIADDHTRGIS